MDNDDLIPCKRDHPNCCTEMTRGDVGGCCFLAEEGSDKCVMHGAATRHIRDAKAVRNYRLAKWGSRINELAENPNVKTLRDEIGIARMTMEAILVRCKTPTDLFIYSNKISEMLVRIEKLVSTCNRLEDRLGITLDKSAVVMIGEQIINIVALYVPEEQLEQLSTEIADVILLKGNNNNAVSNHTPPG